MKERLVKKALLCVTCPSQRELGELSAMLMFGGFAERHGCRDLGLVRGLARQGSATGDPCNFTFLHVLLCQWSMSLSLNSRSSDDRTPDTVLLASTATIYAGIAGVSASEHLQTSQIPNVHVLGQRHTVHTFGRDSAANWATVHIDWLSVSCPCRLPPIQSHGRLHSDR